MSWSVAANGKATEVARKIEEQFETFSPCAEPEESIRQGARKLIVESLQAQITDRDVRVSAFGSQSVIGYGSERPAEVRNSLSISVTLEN